MTDPEIDEIIIVAAPAGAMAVMALVFAASDHMLLSFLMIGIGAGIAQMQRLIER
jgi:hypothetical protein